MVFGWAWRQHFHTFVIYSYSSDVRLPQFFSTSLLRIHCLIYALLSPPLIRDSSLVMISSIKAANFCAKYSLKCPTLRPFWKAPRNITWIGWVSLMVSSLNWVKYSYNDFGRHLIGLWWRPYNVYWLRIDESSSLLGLGNSLFKILECSCTNKGLPSSMSLSSLYT